MSSMGTGWIGMYPEKSKDRGLSLPAQWEKRLTGSEAESSGPSGTEMAIRSFAAAAMYYSCPHRPYREALSLLIRARNRN